jgi:hypothetical protein
VDASAIIAIIGLKKHLNIVGTFLEVQVNAIAFKLNLFVFAVDLNFTDLFACKV